MIARVRSAAAIATAAFLLSACSGGTNSTNVVPPNATLLGGPTLPASGNTFAGIGDNLTAGVQSGGLLGVNLPGPLGVNAQVGTIAPAGVQATQEHGFFALLWSQANGTSLASLSNPATSPLPLIGPSGLGGLLAPTTSGFPAQIGTPCAGTQAAANQFGTALQLRLSPGTVPYDVAIPGQTAHEALFMTGAIGDCTIAPGNTPAAIVGLNALVNGESQNFWPILAGFGSGVTQVNAAASLHARYATVWLGSNDLLKIAFSGGAAPVTSPQSMHDDIKAIVQKMQASGSKVAVANLVEVMGAAVFIPQPAYQPTLQAYITAVLVQKGVPAATAAAIATQYSTAYATQETTQTGLGSNGYFTINALFATLAAASAQLGTTPPSAPVAPTLGAGTFVSDAVATEVKQLNTAYNAAIATAASETGAALVDEHAVFVAIQTAGGVPVNPPKCCSLVYRGGFFSLDGVHPSNTGYALIANTFIDAINAAYGAGIPDVNVASVYATDPYAPGNGVSGFDVLRSTR